MSRISIIFNWSSSTKVNCAFLLQENCKKYEKKRQYVPNFWLIKVSMVPLWTMLQTEQQQNKLKIFNVKHIAFFHAFVFIFGILNFTFIRLDLLSLKCFDKALKELFAKNKKWYMITIGIRYWSLIILSVASIWRTQRLYKFTELHCLTQTVNNLIRFYTNYSDITIYKCWI